MFDTEFRRSMMEDALGELVKELEKCVPEDVKEDLHKMAACQARITARIRLNKALSSEDVKLYNDMCYKHFGKVQDGEEFTKEEPEDERVPIPMATGPVRCAKGKKGNWADASAEDIVHNYVVETFDKSEAVPDFEVYVVWKCKTLQNWKYLLSTTLPDGMYYELTFNGDKSEWYLDAYRKVANKAIKEGALL